MVTLLLSPVLFFVNDSPFDSSIEIKMMIPICVGHNSSWASRVGRSEHASNLGCSHDHTLYVSDAQGEGMFPFSVGHAGSGEEWRHNVVEVSCSICTVTICL